MNYELRIKNTLEKVSNFKFRISNFLSASKKHKGLAQSVTNRDSEAVLKVPTFKTSRFSTAGFTLLLAVVLSSLLLSIGVAVFNSTFKGLELSSLGRDSQFAFYAADAGLECALYWDIRGRVFATSTASSPPSSGVNCAEQDIAQSWSVTTTSTTGSTSYNLTFLPQDFCAIVLVNKTKVGSVQKTVIEARGYNTCNTASTRRVERAIRMSYE